MHRLFILLTALFLVVSVQGQTVQAPDGSVTDPGFQFQMANQTGFWRDASGNLDFSVDGEQVLEFVVGGTQITIGEADAEDTALVWDGNAQDFHIGVDDSADDLVFGVGSALGTTTAFAIDEDQATTFTGGLVPPNEDVTAVNTLTASECGKIIFLNSATEFESTLPAPTAGCYFRFVVKAAPSGAAYTIVTNASGNVIIGGINELEVDTSDDGPYDTNADTITFADGVAVVGDFVEMYSDGTSWYISGQTNADGGITLTTAS